MQTASALSHIKSKFNGELFMLLCSSINTFAVFIFTAHHFSEATATDALSLLR